MSLNAFPFLYEKATLRDVRISVQHLLANGIPPIRPDMRILDLACGTGSVTRVLYEHCAANNINPPPKIVGVDIGSNFIEAYRERAESLNWHTAEAHVGDASKLNMLSENSFDLVIMAFGLFAVNDDVANAVGTEIQRVLKPGGTATFTIWKENWVERMILGANAAIGRPEDEYAKFRMGKWLEWETTQNILLAGGFEVGKIKHHAFDHRFKYVDMESFLDEWSSPFWLAIAARTWTDEEKRQWRDIVKALITEEDKRNGGPPAKMWVFFAEK
jgi:ubiquinone/menaquinone biosynthesis C-methylase UbiE